MYTTNCKVFNKDKELKMSGILINFKKNTQNILAHITFIIKIPSSCSFVSKFNLKIKNKL